MKLISLLKIILCTTLFSTFALAEGSAYSFSSLDESNLLFQAMVLADQEPIEQFCKFGKHVKDGIFRDSWYDLDLRRDINLKDLDQKLMAVLKAMYLTQEVDLKSAMIKVLHNRHSEMSEKEVLTLANFYKKKGPYEEFKYSIFPQDAKKIPRDQLIKTINQLKNPFAESEFRILFSGILLAEINEWEKFFDTVTPMDLDTIPNLLKNMQIRVNGLVKILSCIEVTNDGACLEEGNESAEFFMSKLGSSGFFYKNGTSKKLEGLRIPGYWILLNRLAHEDIIHLSINFNEADKHYYNHLYVRAHNFSSFSFETNALNKLPVSSLQSYDFRKKILSTPRNSYMSETQKLLFESLRWQIFGVAAADRMFGVLGLKETSSNSAELIKSLKDSIPKTDIPNIDRIIDELDRMSRTGSMFVSSIGMWATFEPKCRAPQ